MVALYFMKKGHIKTIQLENKHRLNADWYITECLPKAFETVCKKRLKQRFMFDNSRAHTVVRTHGFLANEGIHFVTQPSFSNDLNPCDFFLFGKLKLKLKWRHFIKDIEVLTYF